MRRVVAGFAAVLGIMALPLVAAAHNAGHIFLPDGSCHEVGSFKHAPLVGQDRTQLDLVPSTPNPPFDEIGVSFVGYHGNTPIVPGPCGPPPPMDTSSTGSEPGTDAATVGTTAGGPFFSLGPQKDM